MVEIMEISDSLFRQGRFDECQEEVTREFVAMRSYPLSGSKWVHNCTRDEKCKCAK
jgi:hypothetical protein